MFLSQSAQSTAEEAIASVKSTIAADIPNSDCAFDEFEVNMFDRAANASCDIPHSEAIFVPKISPVERTLTVLISQLQSDGDK